MFSPKPDFEESLPNATGNRVFDIDSYSPIPKGCYSVGGYDQYYSGDTGSYNKDHLNNLRRDLCVWDYQQRSPACADDPYNSACFNNYVSPSGSTFDKNDFFTYWTEYDVTWYYRFKWGSYKSSTTGAYKGNNIYDENCARVKGHPNGRWDDVLSCNTPLVKDERSIWAFNPESCVRTLECVVFCVQPSISPGSGLSNYKRDCGGTSFIFQRKKWHDHRVKVFNDMYNDEENMEEHCREKIESCNGQTTCDLAGCARDYIHYANVDLRTAYKGALVTHHYADSLNEEKTISCPRYLKLIFLKADFGKGFDVEDAVGAIRPDEDCRTSNRRSICKVSANNIAQRLSKNPIENTIRVETICSCPEGCQFYPQPFYPTCRPCGEGTYRLDNMGSCEPVPQGHYSESYINIYNRRRKTPCPIGTFSDTLGAQSCQKCPPGTWNDEEGAKTSKKCKVCPEGSVSPSEGRGTHCQRCLQGEEPNEDQTACIPCPPGTSNPSLGSICVDCTPGRYQDESGQLVCKRAPKGSFQPSSGASKAVLCPRGFYTDETGQIEPESCPPGDTTPFIGSTKHSDCARINNFECPEESTWKLPTNTKDQNCRMLVEKLNDAVLLSDVTMNEVGNGFCQSCLNVSCHFAQT